MLTWSNLLHLCHFCCIICFIWLFLTRLFFLQTCRAAWSALHVGSLAPRLSAQSLSSRSRTPQVKRSQHRWREVSTGRVKLYYIHLIKSCQENNQIVRRTLNVSDWSSECLCVRCSPPGKIISIETSALRATGRPGWEDLVRKCIYAFFQPQGKEPSHAKKLLQEGEQLPLIAEATQLQSRYLHFYSKIEKLID